MPRRTLRAIALACTLVAGFVLATVAFAADAEPDPDFGTGGSVALPFDDITAWDAPLVDEAADGGIAVAQAGVRFTPVRSALQGRGIRVWRLGEDGAADASFQGGQPVDVTVADPTRGLIVEDVRAETGAVLVLVRVLNDGPYGDHRLVTVPAAGTATITPLDAGEDCRRPYGARFAAATIEAVYECDFVRGRGRAVAPWEQRSFGLTGAPTGTPRDLGPLADAPDRTDLDLDAQGRLVVLTGETEATDEPDWRVSRPGLEETLAEGLGLSVRSLDTYADGGFVVGGIGAGDAWTVLRFDAAGAPVGSFGTGGAVSLDDAALHPGGLQSVTALPGGGVLLVGHEAGGALAAVRLTATGARDTTFGPQGIRTFTSDDEPFQTLGDTLVDAEGRLLLSVTQAQIAARRGAAAPGGAGVLLLRLGRAATPTPTTTDPGTTPTVTTPADTTPTTTTTTPSGTTPAPVQGQAPSQQAPRPVVTTKAKSKTRKLRSCLSRRKFTIRLRPKALRSAKVRVAGKAVDVTRNANGRLTAVVDLRKLKQSTFTVSVTAVDAQGRTVRETRRYRTCRFGKNGPKVKGGSIIRIVQG